MAVALRVFGSRHPAVAAETSVLAVFLVEHGRNREAEACYRQSMEIWERTLGPYSPELASGLNNLAILLFMEDRPGCVRRRRGVGGEGEGEGRVHSILCVAVVV